MNPEENERQYRLVNQMLTAHSVLRDRFRRLSRTLTVLFLCFSISLNAFVFVNDDTLKRLFWVDPSTSKIGLGLVSVVLLILSLVDLVVDWAGRAREHGRAVELLSQLKAEYRENYNLKSCKDYVALTTRYNDVTKMIPPIPERLFLKLKAQHLFKKMLAEAVDKSPGMPIFLLALKLRWNACRVFLFPTNAK